jgi:hypothetical protein
MLTKLVMLIPDGRVWRQRRGESELQGTVRDSRGTPSQIWLKSRVMEIRTRIFKPALGESAVCRLPSAVNGHEGEMHEQKPPAIAGFGSRGDYNSAPVRSPADAFLDKPSLIKDGTSRPAFAGIVKPSFLHLPFCSSRLIFWLVMSLQAARTAMSSLRNSSTSSKQRLSQVQRHFSATTSARKEIQEAYILSASRTPTAKVCSNYMPACSPANGLSSMDRSPPSLLPSLAQ